jgi:methyltransferase (TIGR00027 family)
LSNCFADRIFARSASFPPTRALLRLLEAATLPGIIFHYWNRKRWIESQCTAAINDGFRRVVIVGAGYDTLGLRLVEKFSEIDVVEIDHPATQSCKLKALNEALKNRIEFIPLNLTKDSVRLKSVSSEPTLFLMEGLLMYLEAEAVIRLFGDICALPPTRTRIIFSFMSKWPDGSSGFRPTSRLAQSWLKWRGEPFLWSIEPHAISEFVSKRGFRLMEIALTQDLTANDSSLDGENLVMCER